MAVLPTNLTFGSSISSQLMRASNWVQGVFGVREFSSDETLASLPLVDERLRPKAPMPKDDIEIITRLNLSNMGLRNAQQVTAESHPELHATWATLCQRAGYGANMPQLIVTESKVANAMEITDSEMVITTGLLKMLTLREVAGVLGHELGHGRRDHGGPRVAATAAFGGAGMVLGNYAAKKGMLGETVLRMGQLFGHRGEAAAQWLTGAQPRHQPISLLGYGAMMAAGAGIGMVAANHVSVKPTELQADLDGVAISGDGEALASALIKMQAADPRGPVGRWFGYMVSGYPTVNERVANIRRASADMPANPVPITLEPVPQLRVHGATLGERVEADKAQPTLGNG